jgi:hypothetical protein
MVEGDFGSAARSWLQFHVSSPCIICEGAIAKLTFLAITQLTSALCSASSYYREWDTTAPAPATAAASNGDPKADHNEVFGK